MVIRLRGGVIRCLQVVILDFGTDGHGFHRTEKPQITQISSQTEMGFPLSTLTLFSPNLYDSEARPEGHAYGRDSAQTAVGWPFTTRDHNVVVSSAPVPRFLEDRPRTEGRSRHCWKQSRIGFSRPSWPNNAREGQSQPPETQIRVDPSSIKKQQPVGNQSRHHEVRHRTRYHLNLKIRVDPCSSVSHSLRCLCASAP